MLLFWTGENCFPTILFLFHGLGLHIIVPLKKMNNRLYQKWTYIHHEIQLRIMSIFLLQIRIFLNILSMSIFIPYCQIGVGFWGISGGTGGGGSCAFQSSTSGQCYALSLRIMQEERVNRYPASPNSHPWTLFWPWLLPWLSSRVAQCSSSLACISVTLESKLLRDKPSSPSNPRYLIKGPRCLCL